MLCWLKDVPVSGSAVQYTSPQSRNLIDTAQNELMDVAPKFLLEVEFEVEVEGTRIPIAATAGEISQIQITVLARPGQARPDQTRPRR